MPVAAHVPHRHAPRRVLVTSAAGTLGRAVVREFAPTGVDVAVDRRPPPARSDDGHGRVVSVDVRDARQVREVMAECDGVVHLAAHPGPGAVPDEELFSNNTLATFTVISAAAGHGIRSVAIASSICIYGTTYAARPFSLEHVPTCSATRRRRRRRSGRGDPGRTAAASRDRRAMKLPDRRDRIVNEGIEW